MVEHCILIVIKLKEGQSLHFSRIFFVSLEVIDVLCEECFFVEKCCTF